MPFPPPGILPTQGSNSSLLCRQADPWPPRHKGSPSLSVLAPPVILVPAEKPPPRAIPEPSYPDAQAQPLGPLPPATVSHPCLPAVLPQALFLPGVTLRVGLLSPSLGKFLQEKRSCLFLRLHWILRASFRSPSGGSVTVASVLDVLPRAVTRRVRVRVCARTCACACVLLLGWY